MANPKRGGWGFAVVGALCVVGGSPVHAEDAGAQLDRVLAGFSHVKANFTQTVQSQGQTKHASGTLSIEKPGKFRWEYVKPAQIVVSNGKTLWFYDVDLAQVNIRPLNDVLTDTPAELLAGELKWRSQFTLVAQTQADHRAVLELVPKAKSSEFKSIKLVVSGDAVVSLEWVDKLNQVTKVALDHWDTLSPMAAHTFELSIPADVDVVGKP